MASPSCNMGLRSELERVVSENKVLQSKVTTLEARNATLLRASGSSASPMSSASPPFAGKKRLDLSDSESDLSDSGSEPWLPSSQTSSRLLALQSQVSGVFAKQRKKAEMQKKKQEEIVAQCQTRLDEAIQTAKDLGDSVQVLEQAESESKEQPQSKMLRHNELQALQEAHKAAQELVTKLVIEKKKHEDIAMTMAAEVDKMSMQEATLTHHTTSMGQACGPLVERHATEGNLVSFALMDAVVEQRLQQHSVAIEKRFTKQSEELAMFEKRLCEKLDASSAAMASQFDSKIEEQSQTMDGTIEKQLGQQLQLVDATVEKQLKEQAKSIEVALQERLEAQSQSMAIAIQERFEKQSQDMDAAVAKRLETQSQILDAAVEKRFCDLKLTTLKAMPIDAEALQRLLSAGALTVKTATEDFSFGEKAVVESVKKLCEEEAANAEASLRGLVEEQVSTQCLVTAGFSVKQLLRAGVGIKHLADNGNPIKQLLNSGGCTHLEVAQALCKALPEAPPSSKGAVVTYIFTGPEIQRWRQDGKLAYIASEELRWDGVMDTQFQYSFKLWLYPNGYNKETKGAAGLFWELTYGPHGDQRAWPMPPDQCTVTLRVLCGIHTASGDGQHRARTLGGRTDEGFRSYLKAKVPQGGVLTNCITWGYSSFLSVEQAGAGDFFLGPYQDAIAVQCELRLA